MPDPQAGTQLLGGREEVELTAQQPVVAALGLLETVQVRLQVVLRRPRRAVDPRELRLLLVSPPVGTGERRQRERADPAGGGNVRPEAEVHPQTGAIQDDRVSRPDLAFLRREVFDDLALEVLILQPGEGFGARNLLAEERLVLCDDRTHLVLDARKVVSRHVLRDRKVVVEAVGDRRSDRVLRSGPQPADGLGEDVRGRMANDAQSVIRSRFHRLDRDIPLRHEGEIPQLAVHLRRDRLRTEDAPDRLPLGELRLGAVGKGQAGHVLEDSRRLRADRRVALTRS